MYMKPQNIRRNKSSEFFDTLRCSFSYSIATQLNYYSHVFNHIEVIALWCDSYNTVYPLQMYYL